MGKGPVKIPAWALGLDLGTTALKAVLVDSENRVAAAARRPAPLSEGPDGRSEIPLDPFLKAASSALAEILRKAPPGIRLPLGLSSQRSTVVLWDARTGRPLGPALCWRDRRTPREWPPTGLPSAEIVRRTGLRLSPHYSAGKIARVLERRRPPSGWKAAPLPSWLLWRWSGGRILATDSTLAARMLLWNLGTGDWDPRLMAAFGIPRKALARLIPSSGCFGRILREGRTLDVRAMIGDQQAAAAALGLRPGLGLVNLGTGAFLLVPTGRQTARAKGLLTTVLWSLGGKTEYALEGTVNSAGALFDHMRRSGLGDPSRQALPTPQQALALPACLPALAGTGAPRWDPGARLCFVGKGNRSQAALMAVAYRLREIWDALPDGHRPRRLLASGGLSACRPLLQALADLTRVEVQPVADRDASAIGAALLARETLGTTPSGPALLPGPSREAGFRRWRRLLS